MTTLRSLAEEAVIMTGAEVNQLNIELIRPRILHFRQLVLKREYDQTLVWTPSTIQAFDIQLQAVEKFGSTAFISDVLPKTLMTKFFTLPFISVGNALIDKNRNFYDYIKPEQIEFIRYRKFSNLNHVYTMENDRIISFSKERLRVRSVFENPLEVKEFSSEQDLKLKCTNTTLEGNCWDDDDMVVEESVAAAILTFFSNNSTRRRNDRNTEADPQAAA